MATEKQETGKTWKQKTGKTEEEKSQRPSSSWSGDQKKAKCQVSESVGLWGKESDFGEGSFGHWG
jgi:hypothetical protein